MFGSPGNIRTETLVVRCGPIVMNDIPQPEKLEKVRRADVFSVEYLGVPYADARQVDGIWYFKSIQGEFKRFAFQDRVRVISGPHSKDPPKGHSP